MQDRALARVLAEELITQSRKIQHILDRGTLTPSETYALTCLAVASGTTAQELLEALTPMELPNHG